ncbi:molecular chaperone [Acrocarpospora macrocephala]|nr:molecular chaperone [Acrocarpospora macrocephala]
MNRTIRCAGRWLAMGGALCLLWAEAPALAHTPPQPNFSLQVSPTRLVIPAGTTTTAQRFQLTNKGRSAFDITVEKADFIAGENGALNFQPNAPYAAAAWATVEPANFRMAAGTTRTVTVRVKMPPDPEPGDHQFALIFKVPAAQDASNIRINRGIATPVFVTVPGPVDSSVEIAGLQAQEFVLGGPVPLTARIRSVGTVHRDFRSSSRLHAQAGGSAVAFPDFTVVRGAIREVATQWDPPLMCVCHVTLSADGSARTVRIVVLPLHLLGIGLAVLLAALLLAWFVRRRYRARVLAAAIALNGTDDRRA